MKAQLGVPDMHLPIRYALSYPTRLVSNRSMLSLSQYSTLTFEAPDTDKFPMLNYAFDAISAGGTMPCILNAANEIAVAAFLRGEIRFGQIPHIAELTMSAMPPTRVTGIQDLVEANREARGKAEDILRQEKSRL